MTRLVNWSIALVPTALLGCAALESADKSQEFGKYLRNLHVVTEPCLRQPTDTDGYLLKTCEHVVRNKIEVTTHPNTWSITKIGDETVEGKTALVVHFSCCGPGDVALFDKDNGQLYAYGRKRW
jgi:hypothetical protein